MIENSDTLRLAPGATTMNIRVKICCISSVEEARIAVQHGAAALGLVSSMPSGPGVISESLIREIAGLTPPGVASFLLTSLQSVDSIIAQQKRCGANTLQICDHLTDGTYRHLRETLPGISIVQVIHVQDETAVEEAKRIAEQGVHALLLDSGNQALTVKELGGTGRTHNWDISRRIVEQVDIPVYLAGGLNPDNIAEAVGKVRPFGVDLCSGVRTNQRLDPVKLNQFFLALSSL